MIESLLPIFIIWYIIGYILTVIAQTKLDDFTISCAVMALVTAIFGPLVLLIMLDLSPIMDKVIFYKKQRKVIK